MPDSVKTEASREKISTCQSYKDREQHVALGEKKIHLFGQEYWRRDLAAIRCGRCCLFLLRILSLILGQSLKVLSKFIYHICILRKSN